MSKSELTTATIKHINQIAASLNSNDPSYSITGNNLRVEFLLPFNRKDFFHAEFKIQEARFNTFAVVFGGSYLKFHFEYTVKSLKWVQINEEVVRGFLSEFAMATPKLRRVIESADSTLKIPELV